MKKYLAEMVGTMVLVLMGCGSAVFAGSVAGGVGAGVGTIGVALAFGLSVVAMAYTIGNVSGCHINPAITFGVFLSGRMSGREAAAYMVAQVIGAIVGSAILYALTASGSHGGPTATGANSFADGMMLQAFIAEAVFTFIFVLVVLGATDAKQGAGNLAGLAIGLTLVLVHIVCIPITGTSVNPARSIGPALFEGGHGALAAVALHRGAAGRCGAQRRGMAPARRQTERPSRRQAEVAEGVRPRPDRHKAGSPRLDITTNPCRTGRQGFVAFEAERELSSEPLQEGVALRGADKLLTLLTGAPEPYLQPPLVELADLPDDVPIDDAAPGNPVEELRRQQLDQLLEFVIHQILLPGECVERNILVVRIKERHLLHLDRHITVSAADQQPVLTGPPAPDRREQTDIPPDIRLRNADLIFVLFDGAQQIPVLNGLEQIIDAVYAECPDGPFVVRGDEDDGIAHAALVEDFETLAVGELHVHKNQRVVIGMPAKIIHALTHRAEYAQQPVRGAEPAYRLGKHPGSELFIFYDYVIHHIHRSRYESSTRKHAPSPP